ncbi:hypothetical protein DFH09DRAFT_252777 [Mycena vulgaris]|nr:hypothetical protein DFH09DRAFT_252777 [Mycena vulgaris]
MPKYPATIDGLPSETTQTWPTFLPRYLNMCLSSISSCLAMPKSANELYRRLRSQKHGIPQFTPEPNENLPAEYRQVGVSIGDVGIWSEDSFDVLFNTCWSATHSINAAQGVPQAFLPFPLQTRDISRRLYHSPGSVIASAKITRMALDVGASSVATPFFPATVGSSITFELQSKECAMLVLPEGASREKLLPVETFRAYVRRYSQQWYTFAGGRLPPNGSLFVVTGCDKTASWGIATASTASGCISVSLKFTVVGMVEGSLRPRYEWQDFGSATIRNSREYGSPRTENQCIFIRGFFVPRRTPIFTFITDRFLPLSLSGTRVGQACRECHGKQIEPRIIERGAAMAMVDSESEATVVREDRQDVVFVSVPPRNK